MTSATSTALEKGRGYLSMLVTKEGIFTLYKYFVTIGAVFGALYTGAEKAAQIAKEPALARSKRGNPLHTGIRGSYLIARLAFATGLGAGIGGLTAATAPISMPLYIYFEERKARQEAEDMDAL